MQSYMRHFVSQHLGKSTATVEFSDDGDGHVRISVPHLSPEIVDYAFTLERVAQLVPEEARWPEAIARIAIHQAHKQFLATGKRDLFAPGRELALETSPWLGDLEAVAYGGATTGYHPRGS
jgi:hypothetical protein